MKMNERLRLARERRGFGSASEAAEALGIPYGTYSGHENGSRGITRKNVARYAKFFGVSIAWLEHGIGEDGLPEQEDIISLQQPETADVCLQKAIALAEGAMLAAGLDPEYLDELRELLRECYEETVVSSTPQSALESRRNLTRSATSKLLRQLGAQPTIKHQGR